MRRSAMSIFGRRTDDWESFTLPTWVFKILVNGLPCDRHYCVANAELQHQAMRSEDDPASASHVLIRA